MVNALKSLVHCTEKFEFRQNKFSLPIFFLMHSTLYIHYAIHSHQTSLFLKIKKNKIILISVSCQRNYLPETIL